MIVRAIIEFDTEVHSYSATCPELNFISSCGTTKEEAVKNLKEAIVLMFEPIPEKFLTKGASTEDHELMEFVI